MIKINRSPHLTTLAHLCSKCANCLGIDIASLSVSSSSSSLDEFYLRQWPLSILSTSSTVSTAIVCLQSSRCSSISVDWFPFSCISFSLSSFNTSAEVWSILPFCTVNFAISEFYASILASSYDSFSFSSWFFCWRDVTYSLRSLTYLSLMVCLPSTSYNFY